MKNLTPKRAAAILINDFLSGLCLKDPWFMTNEEMSKHLNWNATDNRKQEIVTQLNAIIKPFRTRLKYIIGEQ